eukprot:TRINITY_DN26028_c0_g1_i1.p1 TRINITY_DN26028_c0_g1~~TRINITY_DN26028_c0_g1_i1.p1  ORF type:complete len:1665 (+),score=439.36 TRINITY_DN26028_c0_g1_i1:67-5061(+)
MASAPTSLDDCPADLTVALAVVSAVAGVLAVGFVAALVALRKAKAELSACGGALRHVSVNASSGHWQSEESPQSPRTPRSTGDEGVSSRRSAGVPRLPSVGLGVSSVSSDALAATRTSSFRHGSRHSSASGDSDGGECTVAPLVAGDCVVMVCRWATPAESAPLPLLAAARDYMHVISTASTAHGGSLEAASGDEVRVSFGLRTSTVVTGTPLVSALRCTAAMLHNDRSGSLRVAVVQGFAAAGLSASMRLLAGAAPATGSQLVRACEALGTKALLAALPEAFEAAQSTVGRELNMLRTAVAAPEPLQYPVFALAVNDGSAVQEAWRAVDAGKKQSALTALVQHCEAQPTDTVSQALLAHLRYGAEPQELAPRVVCEPRPPPVGIAESAEVAWRMSVHLVVQHKLSLEEDAGVDGHRALLAVFEQCVRRHRGEMECVTGARLGAKWLAPVTAAAGDSEHMRAASVCALDIVTAMPQSLAAGLALGEGLCLRTTAADGTETVSILGLGGQKAEVLAAAAQTEGFELLAEGAIMETHSPAPNRVIAPTAEMAQGGTPSGTVSMNGGVVEIGTASDQVYSGAVQEIRRWHWANAVERLQRLTERGVTEEDFDTWAPRLLNAVVRAEREERDGLRGAHEDLVADLSNQGLKFRACAAALREAAAAADGSPKKQGRARSTSRARNALAPPPQLAANNEDVLSNRSFTAPERKSSLRSLVKMQSVIKRSAQKFKSTLSKPQLSGANDGASDDPALNATARSAATRCPDTDRSRIFALARQELAEYAAPAGLMQSPSMADTDGGTNVDSPGSAPGALPAPDPCVTTQSGLASPASSKSPRRKRGQGLRMLRNRELVRDCLFLQPQVPQDLIDALKEDDHLKSAGQCWHLVAKWWNPLRMIALLYNCMLIPARSVYGGQADTAAGPIILLVLDYLLDLVYWGDIVLNFREPITIDGNRVTDKQIIAREYLRSWFAFDVVMCAPWELVLAMFYGFQILLDKPHLRSNRCLNILRFKDLVDTIHQDFFEDVHPVKMQLFVFLVSLFYWIHWLGCLWGLVYVGALSGEHDPDIYGVQGKDAFHQLSMGFYWAITGFSGYSMIWPLELRHVVVSLVCALCGLGIFATVIAYMSTLLKLMGTSHQAHIDQVERLVTYCEHTNVDEEFVKSLLQYHRMLWLKTRQAFPEQWADLFAEVDQAVDSSLQLPGDLAREVLYFSNFRVVENVPVLRSGCNPSFIAMVVTHVKAHYGAPGEPLFVRGGGRDTAGDNSGIWFLVLGTAEASIGARVVEELGAGDHWGEIVGLGLSETQGADVRLLEHSELYHMPLDDFQALVEHPHFDGVDADFRAVAARRQKLILEAAKDVKVAHTPFEGASTDESFAALNTVNTVRTLGSASSFRSTRLSVPPRPPMPPRLTNASTKSFAGLLHSAYGSIRSLKTVGTDVDTPQEDVLVVPAQMRAESRGSGGRMSAGSGSARSPTGMIGRGNTSFVSGGSDEPDFQRVNTGPSEGRRQRRVSIATASTRLSPSSSMHSSFHTLSIRGLHASRSGGSFTGPRKPTGGPASPAPGGALPLLADSDVGVRPLRLSRPHSQGIAATRTPSAHSDNAYIVHTPRRARVSAEITQVVETSSQQDTPADAHPLAALSAESPCVLSSRSSEGVTQSRGDAPSAPVVLES